MRRLLWATGLAASFLASGCSIHPLPQDVTGVTTYHIVRQIRCEARETIKSYVIQYVDELAAAYPTIKLFGGLASRYQNDPAAISSFSPNLFKGAGLSQVYSTVKIFYDAGIAYNFELTMTEDNNLSTELDFIRPIVNPKFALTLNGGASRKRTNDRTFTTSDTFGGLLKLPEEYCRRFVVGPNYIYPMVGHIGISAVMSDFINLTLFGNLAAAKATASANPGTAAAGSNSSIASASGDPADAYARANPPKAAGGTKAGAAKVAPNPPTLADKLTFTTSITGSINPVATFTPLGRNFQVSGASLTGLADRVDMHQVTVALAINPTDITDLGSLRQYLFSPARVATAYGRMAASISTSVVVGNRVIGGGTPSEQLALIAVDQFKSREIEIIPAL
jgi:hypothetical protein